ncbi:MAG: hypothetical protein K2Z81_02525 [Cyanobacteria bacterium]|nr:hypothetical protein [Cyanobacteriota bacterium]
MIPSESFSLEYRDSPAGLYLARSVRAFVKAKRNPTTINGELVRAQFLCTPKNHVGETDPHFYHMTFVTVDGLPRSYYFKVEGVGITNSINSELGDWLIDNPENSFEMTIKDLDDRGLEPVLLSILNMNRAKFHLDQIRKEYTA